MKAPAPRVAVVGAGWSGLACALALVDAGAAVTLLESARHAGGRARGLDLELGGRRYRVDNGQHLLIGAYTRTLQLLRRIGVARETALLEVPFQLVYPDGWAIVAARGPSPWHLLRARTAGLPLAHRLALGSWVAARAAGRWRLRVDRPARELFAGHPSALVERLWEPLCLSALNVRLAEASGRTFLRVLRDSLGARASASRMLLPAVDLSALFADAAVRALQAAGPRFTLRTGATVEGLVHDGRWTLAARDGPCRADAVVIATGPAPAVRLLDTLAQAALAGPLQALRDCGSAPIATVYLRLPDGTRLPHPLMAMTEDPPRGEFGQWIFDRGAWHADNPGLLAVVISGDGPHLALPHAALGAAVAGQVRQRLGLPPALGTGVIVERRATIRPRPGLERPGPRLPPRGLYLAGDAARSPYPSTLEGSVRAGLAAAQAVFADFGSGP